MKCAESNIGLKYHNSVTYHLYCEDCGYKFRIMSEVQKR
jgi:hypothetical protein